MQCKSCYEGTEFFRIIYMNFMIQRINYYMSSPFGASTAVHIFPVIISVCQWHCSSASLKWAACPSIYITSCPSGRSVFVSYFRFLPLSMSQCQFEQEVEVSLRTFPRFVLPGRSVYPVNKLHKCHHTCSTINM
jgi:hypothetical protein